MRVLVACEFSGIVRDAFAARGHDAWSCDLLPSERPGQHIQGDVRNVLADGWGLMIAHPPCTYLSSSGLHWNKRRPARAALTEAALDFVRELLAAPVERIALENPVGCISSRIRLPDQTIQPWQFGHAESKATCLWLKNLPLIRPSATVGSRYLCGCGHRFDASMGKYGCPNCEGEHVAVLRDENVTMSGQNKLPPSAERWRERSRTYEGIAAAMADQWGDVRAFQEVLL
jgi:hypothetical protein